MQQFLRDYTAPGLVKVSPLHYFDNSTVNGEKLKMKRFIAGLLSLFLYSLSAEAALQIGSKAPEIEADASMAGEHVFFSLAGVLRRGPVVLYFYPESADLTCADLANKFAIAAGEFEDFNATMAGVSVYSLEALNEATTRDCLNESPVISDSELEIRNAFDANLENPVSFAISPDGEIVHAYSGANPLDHIAESMDAIQDWMQTNVQEY